MTMPFLLSGLFAIGPDRIRGVAMKIIENCVAYNGDQIFVLISLVIVEVVHLNMD
jgi:hypothetical protein